MFFFGSSARRFFLRVDSKSHPLFISTQGVLISNRVDEQIGCVNVTQTALIILWALTLSENKSYRSKACAQRVQRLAVLVTVVCFTASSGSMACWC